MLLLASFCTDDRIMTAIKLVKLLLQIMQMLIPIGLIVLGSIDLAKAVISIDEEGASKKGRKKFINRCIAAVLVFLSATIVRTVFGIAGFGGSEWEACWDSVNTVKPITCNYSSSIKISIKNDITYTSWMCDVADGLNATDFTNGCPTKVYYKLDNPEASAGKHCTFTTKKQPASAMYSKATLISSEKYVSTDDNTNDSTETGEYNDDGYRGGTSSDGNTHSSSGGKF
jgi:hypothetical protein